MSIHIWESPSPKDHLLCQREIGNPHNTHAVAVKGNIVGLDGTTTVEHAPKKISTICSIFIRCGGTINCVVNGECRFLQTCRKVDLKYPVF